MIPQSWVGRTIGNRYKLETLVGAGGMSAVYRAYDPNLRRVVAVKLIHPHLSDNPNFIDRFKEEAAAVASLRHPNIVQVHDFNNEGDTYYMVMEYLAGETLQAHLRRIHTAGRHMPLPEALRISRQVCDAAGYAHHHDLIHRDIKPANIMLDIYGQSILMDFGIVKIVGGQYHTATGATIGTAIYMSPEQIRSERLDERSDIYSMGVMLFEMLSGRPPYEADSALTLMMMHLNDPVPNPCDLRSDVSPQLAAIVIKALAKDRNQRYHTAAEMSGDLHKIELALTSISTDSPTVATIDVTSPDVTPSAADSAPTEKEDDLIPHAYGQIVLPQPADAAGLALVPNQPIEGPTLATPLTVHEPAEVENPPPVSHVPSPIQTSKDIKSAVTEYPLSQTDLAVIGPESSLAVELDASVISEVPAFRRLPRFVLPLSGLALLAVVALALFWFTNQRRPPTLQLMPIEQPSAPISLENQSNLVNLGQWQVDASCQQLAYSPDSGYLASICNREQMRYSPYRYYASLYQVVPGALQAHLLDHTGWMKSLDYSPDGTLLATSADDERVNIWQVNDGTLLRTIESVEGPILSLDFSPNGKLLAGAVWNGIGVWQVSNGILLRIYPSNENSMRSVAFSPNGEYLAGGSEAGQVFMWRVSDGVLLYMHAEHTAQVNQLAFSPDGTRLATASDDKTLKLWQVQDGVLLSNLVGHVDGVTGLSFSPDGSLLVSSSWDGTLRLWQASDGLAVRAIQLEEAVLAIVFSPDGVWLTAASYDGRFHFWGMSEAFSLLQPLPGKRP